MSERNLASPDVWADSLSRSRTRRAAAFRAARKRLRTRGGVVSMIAAIAVMGSFAAFAGAQTTLIKKGAEGDGVATVQQALGVEADGVYGPITKAAVTKYQQKQGLTVDGVVGPETLGSLGIGGAKVTNASYSSGGGGGGGGGG